jgi:hypothetical protein
MKNYVCATRVQDRILTISIGISCLFAEDMPCHQSTSVGHVFCIQMAHTSRRLHPDEHQDILSDDLQLWWD